MITTRTWFATIILSLPLSWLIAFLSLVRPMNLDVLIIPSMFALLFGVFGGGFLIDTLRHQVYLLILVESIPLLVGLTLLIAPSEVLISNLLVVAILFFFCLGAELVMMTTFLNYLVSSTQRGRIAGIMTLLTLGLGGVLSLVWNGNSIIRFMLAGTSALLILVTMMILLLIRPWKSELKTYMVPGSITPYSAWWFIYSIAFGLYSLATPLGNRILFQGFPNPFGTVSLPQLVLIGIGAAAFVFALLPDWLGRKRVFSVASVMLGELCIFAPARAGLLPVDIILIVLEVFVLGFILGVGAWLVWTEIGPVRQKGRRASFGWAPVVIIGIIIWMGSVSSFQLPFAVSLLVFPIAATLVLLSLFPLTNATEVIWNERIVEELEIRVDTRQVSKALRELEVETPLISIRQQIENDIVKLTKIRGVTRAMAEALRREGYETPKLIAQAKTAILAQILGISDEAAKKIKANAQKVSSSTPKKGLKRSGRSRRTNLSPSKRKRQSKSK